MAHSENYTEASPTDSTLATSIDDEIVKSRRILRERFAVDHKIASSDDGTDKWGVHTKVTFEARITQPTEPTGAIATLYLKTGDYDSEIRFTDSRDVDNLIVMVGEVKMILGATIPGGWVALNGDTIGNPASGATLAHANYEDLYVYLWDELADSEFPIATGRGGSGAADFAANKAGTLPDARSRMPIGAGTGAGLSARTIGATGGGETVDIGHTHDAGTLAGPSHNHQWYDFVIGSHDKTYNSGGTGIDLPSSVSKTDRYLTLDTDGGVGALTRLGADVFTDLDGTGAVTGSTASGGSATQDVMNPWIAFTYIIKY
jgi:microcystin-dependent protein